MKSYTDLEQSKKLAEILPLESADMFWLVVGDSPRLHVLTEPLSNYSHWDNCPAWSLAALLDILPNNENISTNLSKGGYRVSTLEYTNSWFVEYEDETNGLNNCMTSADNPVDACYKMILKLHKRKML